MRTLGLYLAARIVPGLASMALTFVCIRELGAEAYGRYSLTLLPAALAASLVGGLAGQAMLRHGNELTPAALSRGLVGLPLAASCLASPFVVAYLAATVGLGGPSWLALAAIPLVALIDTRRNHFIARGAARAVFAMDALRALVALVTAYAIFRAAGSTLVAPFVAQLLALTAALALVRPAPVASDATRSLQVDRRYATYGLWFAGWMGVAAGFSLAERSIVEAVSGLAASGRYAAQADVVNAVFATTAGAMASSMMPRYLAMAAGAETAAMRTLATRGVAGVLLAALAALLAGIVLHCWGEGGVARTLAGDAATGSVLVGAGFLWAAAGFLQKPLELRGRTRALFVAVALAFAFFIAVAFGLGRLFGAPGVALAKGLAGMAFIALVVVFTQRGRVRP